MKTVEVIFLKRVMRDEGNFFIMQISPLDGNAQLLKVSLQSHNQNYFLAFKQLSRMKNKRKVDFFFFNINSSHTVNSSNINSILFYLTTSGFARQIDLWKRFLFVLHRH